MTDRQTVFESERVVACRLIPADAVYMAEALNDPDVAGSFGTKYPYSQEDARLFIEDAISNGKPKFALFIKDGERFLGECGFHIVGRAATCSLWIVRSFWNHGYGTEILKAMISFGLYSLDLQELHGYTVPDNAASIRMQKNAGFQFSDRIPEEAIGSRNKQGCLHSYVFRDGFEKDG